MDIRLLSFAHKSFSEFLCAERLKEALEDWTRPGIKRQEFYISAEKLHEEIYDLLGQPILTQEIVAYLRELLFNSPDFRPLALFKRLNDFYDRWCEGEFIDADPPPTLPQKTMQQLKPQGITTGQRQVDVYTGLNVMILCLELHRYAQGQEELREAIVFYPSGQPNEGEEYTDRLLKMIHYSDAIALFTFTQTTGAFLARANLARAFLARANLARADLAYAGLWGADLTNADLTEANLEDITWDEHTIWDGVEGLETARNVPEQLKRQLGLE